MGSKTKSKVSRKLGFALSFYWDKARSNSVSIYAQRSYMTLIESWTLPSWSVRFVWVPLSSVPLYHVFSEPPSLFIHQIMVLIPPMWKGLSVTSPARGSELDTSRETTIVWSSNRWVQKPILWLVTIQYIEAQKYKQHWSSELQFVPDQWWPATKC